MYESEGCKGWAVLIAYENYRESEDGEKLVRRDGLCQKLFVLPRSIESIVLMQFALLSRSVRSHDVSTTSQ